MAFSITTHESGGVVLLRLSGRLTRGDPAETLRETIHRLIDHGTPVFVLDMAAVSYIDSTGLGEIVMSYATAKNGHGHAVLLRPSDHCRKLLHMTKLDQILRMCEDESAAVETAMREVSTPV
jgi:anti-sigma B factor antagonist